MHTILLSYDMAGYWSKIPDVAVLRTRGTDLGSVRTTMLLPYSDWLSLRPSHFAARSRDIDPVY